MGITIRRAVPGDAAVIADFNLRLATETEQLRLNPAVVQAGVSALLNDAAKGVYFVAELDGEVAGQLMITYEWSDWHNGNIWWFQSVYVGEKFRGAGVFTALFNHVRALAETQGGVSCLRLYMETHNSRARRVYDKLGFKKTYYEVLELSLAAPMPEK